MSGGMCSCFSFFNRHSNKNESQQELTEAACPNRNGSISNKSDVVVVESQNPKPATSNNCALFDEIVFSNKEEEKAVFDEFLNHGITVSSSSTKKKSKSSSFVEKVSNMNGPIEACYKKHNKRIDDFHYVRLGIDVEPCSSSPDSDNTHHHTSIPYPTQYRPIPVEERGITILQLLSTLRNVERRCQQEKWKRRIYKDGKPTSDYLQLTPKQVNIHDINEYIIKPFTRYTNKSFVESLPSTAGTQPPRWFISHTWAEAFTSTMDCITTHMNDFECNFNPSHERRGGGMVLETPLWICAFANNQHSLYADIPDNPSETGFVKAMRRAEFRTISILDEEGEIFTRIWCVLELYFTLMFSNSSDNENDEDYYDEGTRALWAVYTPFRHLVNIFEGEKPAVGLVNGGTTMDRGDAFIIARREKKFPVERILNSLKIDVENAQASVEADKRHILNHIAGRSQADLNLKPIKNHANYTFLNNEVKGAFAASSPALIGALISGRKEWKEMLLAMKNGSNIKKLRFDFRHFWDDLTTESAVELISHLPLSIEEIGIFSAPYGSSFINAIIALIGRAKKLRDLRIFISCAGGDTDGRDCGIEFAKALGKSNIEVFQLDRTDLIGSRNIKHWIKAFRKNQKIGKLIISGMARDKAFVNESTYDESSCTIQHNYDDRQRLYYNLKDRTFPDASLTEEEVQLLKDSTSAKSIKIDNISRDLQLGLTYKEFKEISQL